MAWMFQTHLSSHTLHLLHFVGNSPWEGSFLFRGVVSSDLPVGRYCSAGVPAGSVAYSRSTGVVPPWPACWGGPTAGCRWTDLPGTQPARDTLRCHRCLCHVICCPERDRCRRCCWCHLQLEGELPCWWPKFSGYKIRCWIFPSHFS